MKARLLALVALSFALFSTACARLVPFTHELRVEHNLKAEDLKNLQFYVSNDIKLRRELESGGRQVTGGHRLLVISGKTIEEVVVPEGTPGVAVAVDDTTLSISFEPGSSMVFAVPGAGSGGAAVKPLGGFAEPPNPFPGNHRFEPQAPPDRLGSIFGSYFLSIDPGGRVPFQGSLFQAEDDSSRAHLLIDAEVLEEVVQRRKVLPGMRL
jgi:hypothetical protein